MSHDLLIDHRVDRHIRLSPFTVLKTWLMLFAFIGMTLPLTASAITIPASWRYEGGNAAPSWLFFNDGTTACKYAAGALYNKPCTNSGISYSNAGFFTGNPTYGTGCTYTLTYWATCPNTLQVINPLYAQNWAYRDVVCPWPLTNNGYNICTGPDDVTPPANCPKTCNPVQISKGWKYWSETDFVQPFEFKRYYTSRPSNTFLEGGLGQQWRHTFDRSIRASTDPTQVWVIRPDGTYMPFSQNGSGVWTSFYPSTLRLSSSVSGYVVTTDQDDQETYTPSGVLTSILTRQGLLYTLQYDSYGMISKVTDSFGRTLTFTPSSDHTVIASVTDSNGNQLQYGYTQYGGVGKELTSVSWTDASGVHQRTYLYENIYNASLLTESKMNPDNDFQRTRTIPSIAYKARRCGVMPPIK